MKSFLESVKNLFAFKPLASTGNILVLAVKCGHCGETVTLRVNKVTDLQPDWDSGQEGYLLTKEVQDAKCFKIIKLSARFDQMKNLVSAEVSGGELLGHGKNEVSG